MKAAQTIMGLPVSLELVDGVDPDAAVQAVWAELRRVDRTYSPYRPDSVVSALNQGTLARTDTETQAILAACEQWCERTGGAFNAMRPDGRLDPSGYVKGWAIYRAARLLDARLITRYLLSAGGDMQIRGQAPNGGPWRIGIEHPFEPGRYAKVLALQDCAVATSGTRHRGQHIYDPRSGAPAAGPVSLTVIGATIDHVDTLATAAFVMGEAGLEFIQSQGCEGMLIWGNGQVVLTPGFHRYEAANN